jgi:O-succinylbenzoate synthase
MRISSATCYQYTLPLRAPLDLGAQTIRRRRGALLRVTGEDGTVGWGDAAPLPGFSAESVDETIEALAHRARALHGGEVPEAPGRLLRWEGAREPPSVRFAVQSALLECRAASSDTTVGPLLGGGRRSVALNALVPAGASDLAAAGTRLRRAGFPAVKLKVGRTDPLTDAERVRALHSGLGDEIALRLDANRAWSMGDATRFAEAVAPVPLEYVEEPLARPDRLADFAEESGLPVALDETTRERAPGTLSAPDGLAAVVLKPTLLGGLAVTRRWTTWAARAGALTVFSSSYESGVGTRMLLALSSSWSDAPAGLSAHMRLSEDVLRPRLRLDGPAVAASAGEESRVDRARLSRVPSS